MHIQFTMLVIQAELLHLSVMSLDSKKASTAGIVASVLPHGRPSH